MSRKPMNAASHFERDDDWTLDLDDLLHPAQAFEHPTDVVNDPDLTLNEKRAILASWASDASVCDAAPMLRSIPRGKTPVRFDEVMEALRTLDQQLAEQGGKGMGSRTLARRRKAFHRRDPSDDGRGALPI